MHTLLLWKLKYCIPIKRSKIKDEKSVRNKQILGDFFIIFLNNFDEISKFRLFIKKFAWTFFRRWILLSLLERTNNYT